MTPRQENVPRRLLKVTTAAERLDASKATVYRLIYAGRLTPYYIGTGKTRPRVRVDEAELEAFMSGCTGG